MPVLPQAVVPILDGIMANDNDETNGVSVVDTVESATFVEGDHIHEKCVVTNIFVDKDVGAVAVSPITNGLRARRGLMLVCGLQSQFGIQGLLLTTLIYSRLFRSLGTFWLLITLLGSRRLSLLCRPF